MAILKSKDDSIFNTGRSVFDTSYEGSDINPYQKFITIYEFYGILRQLFEHMNVLNKEDEQLNKITLLHEYPDEAYDDRSIVVIYSRGPRSIASLTTESVPGNRVQLKPTHVGSTYDLITNGIESTYTNRYENNITLTVYAGSSKDLERVVEYVEAVMNKCRAQLKCFVSDYIYLGQSASDYNQKYQDKRLFSRSLIYNVITLESYTTISEEIKFII